MYCTCNVVFMLSCNVVFVFSCNACKSTDVVLKGNGPPELYNLEKCVNYMYMYNKQLYLLLKFI